MRILVFGDSIVHGLYDTSGGWAQRIANALHQTTLNSMLSGTGREYEVFNLGISGDTTEGVMSRIESEVETRRLYDQDELIIIAVGMNDVVLRNNRAEMDVYEFQEQLEKLSEKALNLTKKVLFVGLTAVDEELTNPWKFSTSGKQFKNERINLFEDTIKQCAIKYEIPFIPVHDIFIKKLHAGEKLLSDGLHPNNEGHALIAAIVHEAMTELLR